MGAFKEIPPVGLAGDVTEVPTDVLEELEPFRFIELVDVLPVGVRKEPVRLRLNWDAVELPVGSFEELALFRFTEVVVSVGRQDPVRPR